MTLERKEFYPTERIYSGVRNKLDSTDSDVDVITFVPDGEPTLDINLGNHIDSLKDLEIDIAVITNSSLLWMKEVRNDLSNGDIVSVKVDSVDDNVWRKIDRPHGKLEIEKVLEGIMLFSDEFKGRLWTETMLVRGINDGEENLERTGDFIKDLDADQHHITVPIRPPAESDVMIPDDTSLSKVYAIYSERLDNVTMTTGKEAGRFGSTGELAIDILSTCAVHPMREDSIRELVSRSGGVMDTVDDLVREGRLKVTEYRGVNFYLTV